MTLGIALSLAVGAAPRSGDWMPVPEGFAAGKLRGVDQLVVYARVVGERKQGVDRKNIEQVCSAARQLDKSVPTPVFESGWDKPAVVTIDRFENSRWRALFTTANGYACSNASDLPRTQLARPCGCIFKNIVARRTSLRMVADGHVDTIDVDHEARTVRRHTVTRRPDGTDPDRAAELAARLAPAVTGSETIVGLTCEVRRQDLPGGSWQEWCITPNDAKLVPDARLRARALRHAQYSVGAGGTVQILSDRTVQLVPDVLVDESFFSVPPDYAASGSPAPKGRP